ncbi:MAG: sugar ABC transporter substrate-binding protein [Gammaproteobacteria bacterium]|nr:MAG: sugar ABC transporter substrate-binding protein [Gammaproteobacteria bacterium]
MQYISKFLQLIFVSLLLVACSSSNKVITPAVSDGGSHEEYRLGVGDSIEINVWRNADLSRSAQIRPDGKITLPLVGDIVAADLTAVQLSQNITNALSGYVKSPQVTVIVVNSSSSDFQRRVRITGAIKNPQSLAFREGMTVLDLVLLAGGPNEFASSNKSKLYRKVNGEVKVYPIKLDDLINNGDVSTNYPLQPSDIITVPERAF